MSEVVLEVTGKVRTVEAEAARLEILNSGGMLLDVREPAEVAVRAAQGSVNIPRGLLEWKLPELQPDPTAPVYLHCAAGGRAVMAAEQLGRLGYEKVTAISCGVESVCEAFGTTESEPS
jgi:rhodanese-related sulfurtransferase